MAEIPPPWTITPKVLRGHISPQKALIKCNEVKVIDNCNLFIRMDNETTDKYVFLTG
jgi:hypothetical protein